MSHTWLSEDVYISVSMGAGKGDEANAPTLIFFGVGDQNLKKKSGGNIPDINTKN